MLKKCKVCGALNMESATTCVSCGNPLDGTQPVSATSLERTGELPVVSIEEPEAKEPVSIVTPLKHSIDDIKNRQGQEKKKPAQKPQNKKAAKKESQKNASATPHAQNRERKKFQGIGYGTATLLGIVLGLILVFLVL